MDLLKVLRRVGCEYHGPQFAPVATGSGGGCRRTATPEADEERQSEERREERPDGARYRREKGEAVIFRDRYAVHAWSGLRSLSRGPFERCVPCLPTSISVRSAGRALSESSASRSTRSPVPAARSARAHGSSRSSPRSPRRHPRRVDWLGSDGIRPSPCWLRPAPRRRVPHGADRTVALIPLLPRCVHEGLSRAASASPAQKGG